MPSDAAAAAETLAALRQQIDEVDSRLLAAISERAQFAKLVGETKLAANPEVGGDPVHRPGREARLIRSLLDRHRGPMDKRALYAVWRELIGASIALQKPLTIATSDTTMEMTARLHFGTSQIYEWAATPIAAVAVGQADIGLFEVSDISAWQAAVDLMHVRDDCILLWRLPFTIPAGGWVAVGRGITENSSLDQTLFYTEDISVAENPVVETVCASPEGGTILSISGEYSEVSLLAALGTDSAVQRLGQWPMPLEI
ncbi:MAG: chorismate mutase [Rhodospirillaceae bacterium]|nr:chorismate mutase [Rhodospirillaceae bacterium]